MNIIIYEGKNNTRVDLKSQEAEIVRAKQKQMAKIFNVEANAITCHLTQIYDSNELDKNSTTQKIRVVQVEGNREVNREIEHYNLDDIIAVGYHINSAKATHFRIADIKIKKNI